MSFDVVGTLIDFEGGLTSCLQAIANEANVAIDSEEALSLYRWKAFPDSAAAMAELAKNYRLIAMTNARRWAFAYFSEALGNPFYAAFTADDTGTEKPDPAFFHKVFDFVSKDGGGRQDILHVAQSQYHDIGVSRELGMTNCWIERRHAQKGYGGTIEPAEFTKPDYHFTSMAGLAEAVRNAHD